MEIASSPAAPRKDSFSDFFSKLLGLFHELGFELHRPNAVDLAIDVVVTLDQPIESGLPTPLCSHSSTAQRSIGVRHNGVTRIARIAVGSR